MPIARTCSHEPCSACPLMLTPRPASLTYMVPWQPLSLVPASLRCSGRLAGGHRSHPSSLPCSWLRCRPVRSLVMGAEVRISDWALASKIESTASVDNRLCIDSSLDQAKCDRWIGSQPVSEGSTKRRDLYNCSLPPLAARARVDWSPASLCAHCSPLRVSNESITHPV